MWARLQVPGFAVPPWPVKVTAWTLSGPALICVGNEALTFVASTLLCVGKETR